MSLLPFLQDFAIWLDVHDVGSVLVKEHPGYTLGLFQVR